MSSSRSSGPTGSESGRAQRLAARAVAGTITRDLLLEVWKGKNHIRSKLRAAKLRDLYLAQDAMQFGAYEWGLDSFLDRLHTQIAEGTYTPDPAQVVRAAKAKGLTRPLAFLSPRDALLYRAITWLAEERLSENIAGWAGATQKDRAKQKPKPGDVDAEYADWFLVWLQKQGVIRGITERCPFLVESDIANYFPSVDLQIVQEHLLGNTDLPRDVVRLCVFLLQRVVRHPRFAGSPSLGLPQEPFGASRAIGHSLLVEVDDAFADEGQEGLYARFMDDFVIGAGSRGDGERKVARLQRALEPLGLYPNPAKTRIVATDQYLVDIMAMENGYLDSVDQLLDTNQGEPPLRVIDGLEPAEIAEIEDRALKHRSIPLEERPMRWERVLRRYYRVLGRARSGAFLERSVDDLRDNPLSAVSILEYIRSFPASTEIVSDLFAHIREISDIYEDVPLLILEAVANAPNTGHDADNRALASFGVALCEWIDLTQIHLPDVDRLLAACFPIIGKFGDLDLRADFYERFWPLLPENSLSRLQALPMLMSDGRERAAKVNNALPGLPWSTVLNLEYLRAVESGSDLATGVAVGLLDPQPRLQPTRFHVHSRPLLLLGLLRQVAPQRLAQVARRACDVLQESPDDLRDIRAEQLLEFASQ